MLSQHDYVTRAAKPGDATQFGTVSRWFADRGFGFVRADGSDADLFAHIRKVAGPFMALRAGQRVQFTIGTNERSGRREAQNISVAS